VDARGEETKSQRDEELHITFEKIVSRTLTSE
jgi:hypothetical protein